MPTPETASTTETTTFYLNEYERSRVRRFDGMW